MTMPNQDDPAEVWHKTACVLCSCNCGVEVRLDGRKITRVDGRMLGTHTTPDFHNASS